MKSDVQGMIDPSQMDRILWENRDLIKEFAYITPNSKKLVGVTFKGT